MTRLQQARHLALTDPYWRAYCDGLDDKHHVTDPLPTPEQLTAIQDRINAAHERIKATSIALSDPEPPETLGVPASPKETR